TRNNAIATLKTASQRSPNEHTLGLRATAYEQIRDFKGAAAALKSAVDLTPDNAKLRQSLAQDLFISGQYDEALALYQQFVAESPRETAWWLRIGEIYRAKRDFPKSQEALSRAKAIEPDSPQARYAEVSLFESQGTTDQPR